MQQLPQAAQRHPGIPKGIQDTDRRSSQNRHGVDKPVLLPKVVAQSQQDQHNGHRVDGIQYRHGDAQNHVQPQVANQQGEERNDKNPGAVGNPCKKGGKILRNGIDQTDTGRQTRQSENRRQKHCACAAEHLVDDAPQSPRAVVLKRINTGAAHSHVGQHGVYQRQNHSGQKPCQNRIAHSVPLFPQAEGCQGGGDHQSEIQCGNGVHGIVTLGKALQQRCGCIAILGLGNLRLSPEHEAALGMPSPGPIER